VSYYANGKVSSTGCFKDGSKVKKWKYFSEEGKVDKIEIYKKGKLYKEINYA